MNATVLNIGGLVMLGIASLQGVTEWRPYNAAGIMLFVLSVAVSVQKIQDKRGGE